MEFVSQFLEGHPRAGEPTNFFDKIKEGSKIMTIREDKNEFYRAMFNDGQVIQLRVYKGEQGKSSLINAKSLLPRMNHGYEPVFLRYPKVFVEDPDQVSDPINFAKEIIEGTGLNDEDFWSWHGLAPKDAFLFHFTDFRFLSVGNEII